jgi:hypothetical protein
MKPLERNLDNQCLELPKEIGGRLIHYLSIHPTPCTKKQLLKAVPGRKQLKLKILKALLIEGRIKKIGIGTRGNPFRYFVASQNEAVDVDEVII